MQKTTIICFSGGKDSLACLYTMRDHVDECIVYFGDTGTVFPHMLDFVHKTCDRLAVDLKIIRPSISMQEQTNFRGYPVDILPIDMTIELEPVLSKKYPYRLQSRHECCWLNVWKPVYDAIIESGIKNVIRGAKNSDTKRGVGPVYTNGNGITFYNPIWDWTDRDVFTYLENIGAPLADHYKEINVSFDCWLCTAYLNDPGADGRIKYVKEHYPDLWPILQERLMTVGSALMLAGQSVTDALSMAQE